MSVNKLLLWEKWRPRTIEDCILLPRIKKEIENGVNQHYIFYGHYGTGKTSLARILIGKYSKETPYLELNCSMDTSIDVLRTQIDEFCKFTSIMDVDSDTKYVFLDEFERVSANFQDAFKAFIEKYNKNVRFIITTNHIGKISDGLKSRIKQISFDCQNPEEEKFLKMSMFKKIKDVILPEELQHQLEKIKELNLSSEEMIIKKDADKFYFDITFFNKVIGISNTYHSEESCKLGIQSVILNSKDINNYELIDNNYVLKTRNGQIIFKLNITPSDNYIKKIVVKKFPDFRSTLVELQSFLETYSENETTNAMSNKTKLELYNSIYSNSDSEQTYHFLMSNFGADKIDEMIKLLGKPFIDWCLAERKDIDKLFETAYIIADYSYKLETQTDPIILGMTIIGKFKEILKPS